MQHISPSSALAQAFVDGLSRRQLMFQRCETCSHAQTLARYACQACGSEALMWQVSAAHGVVHSVTEVGRAPSDVFKPLVPYTVVIVTLVEGFKLMAHGRPGLLIGDQVEASFFEHDGRVLVRFV